MKLFGRPVLATILFGLVCGVCFLPAVMVLGMFSVWPDPFRLAIWLFLAAYGLMLARWNKTGVRGFPATGVQGFPATGVQGFPATGVASVVCPLVIPLAFAFSNISDISWLATVLLTLSWVRGSAGFKKSPITAIGKETLVCLGGGALVALFTPTGPVAWSLGIWMFFLVQSLWFVSFDETDALQETNTDPFERARKRAEDILASG